MLDKDFKMRLNLLKHSNDIFKKWDAVIDEIIMSTYPLINVRQSTILHCIFHVIWDIGFDDAMYDEVEVRLSDEKTLFPDKSTIASGIRELCNEGIIKSKMSTFHYYDRNGKKISTPSRVIEVPEVFRDEVLNAMAEIFQSTMKSYFSPQWKRSTGS